MSCTVDKNVARSFPELFEEFKQSLQGYEGGAIVSFTGIVRDDAKNHGANEPRTIKVEIEAIEDVSSEVLQGIVTRIEERPGIVKAVIIHFTGVFNVGDPLVHVFVCAAHRQEAFKALEDAVNAYKFETPLWKKEIYSDGTEEWITH
ncbi:MAG TPA: molybdenum cofactor biosynthesis protein MoaE [Candidatus Lokiarchaeia archaeon]|nr:molybdenum cofactor biosynthesis protein MoaE [Candidatus Lokiarchaeia archaeon]